MNEIKKIFTSSICIFFIFIDYKQTYYLSTSFYLKWGDPPKIRCQPEIFCQPPSPEAVDGTILTLSLQIPYNQPLTLTFEKITASLFGLLQYLPFLL